MKATTSTSPVAAAADGSDVDEELISAFMESSSPEVTETTAAAGPLCIELPSTPPPPSPSYSPEYPPGAPKKDKPLSAVVFKEIFEEDEMSRAKVDKELRDNSALNTYMFLCKETKELVLKMALDMALKHPHSQLGERSTTFMMLQVDPDQKHLFMQVQWAKNNPLFLEPVTTVNNISPAEAKEMVRSHNRSMKEKRKLRKSVTSPYKV